jgi:septal ring factor EnvC (AmiA/AmiB activator)
VEPGEALINGLVAVLSASLSSVTTIWVTRRNAPAVTKTADAAFQQQMTASFEALMRQYQSTNQELRKELAAQAERLTKIGSYVVEMTQHIDALETAIVEMGGNPPKRPEPTGIPGFIVLHDPGK